jgi:hypothetical protein
LWYLRNLWPVPWYQSRFWGLVWWPRGASWLQWSISKN